MCPVWVHPKSTLQENLHLNWTFCTFSLCCKHLYINTVTSMVKLMKSDSIIYRKNKLLVSRGCTFYLLLDKGAKPRCSETWHFASFTPWDTFIKLKSKGQLSQLLEMKKCLFFSKLWTENKQLHSWLTLFTPWLSMAARTEQQIN